MAYWLSALSTPAGDQAVAHIQTVTHAHAQTHTNKNK